MYWEWMQENNKSVYDASKHFNVKAEEIWKQIKTTKE